MTTEDGALDEMIRQLAQMPRPDRSYVVEQLGKAEASLIEPRLKRLDVRAMSPALQALVQACGNERTPPMLTRRAASALRTAAACEPVGASHDQPRIGAERGALRHRLGAWLERR